MEDEAPDQMTADQSLRITALDFALRVYASPPKVENILADAEKFYQFFKGA